MTYLEKLRDPRWQRLSALVKERAGWKCQRCGDDSSNLQAHHKAYERRLEPWQYEPHKLECLCAKCHKRVTSLMDLIRSEVANLSTAAMEKLFLEILDELEPLPLTEARKNELEALIF